MKKTFLVAVMVCLLVVVTGCNKGKTKTLTCTLSGTVMEGTTIDTKYTITYTGKYVDKVESVEKVKSNQPTILNAYKQTVEATYSPYKDIKYYDYDIKIDGDTLTSTATINYAKIDTDAMIKVNSSNSMLIKDGKVKVATIKEVYETQLGATCK